MAGAGTPNLSQVKTLIVKLGLATPQQVAECEAELYERSEDPQPLLTLMARKSYLTQFQIEKLLKGDPDGYFLGGYRLLYKIASGSFGRVYRADEPNSGRVVAVKVLRNRWMETPGKIEMFEREGRVGMTLRHPNIVEILAVGKDQKTGQYYLVMEFVEGDNLRNILQVRKKFEPADAVKLLEDVVQGLAFAFSRGVTHRDMKPSNVLVSTQKVAKVVDFGLAQICSSKHFADAEEMSVDRTVDYAGLEKATGVPSGDTRSDIFFLGCVFYEMITGRPPLTPTRDKYQRMQKHRFTDIPPIKPEEVNGPASVIRLAENMMSMDLGRRFQTPTQLLEAVRQVKTELGLAATPAPGLTPATSGGRGAVPTVFVVEADPRLQDAIRDKLRKIGYRALIASDPARAVERFGQQPFAGLIVDAGTTGQEGITGFQSILRDSRERKLSCKGILILSETQEPRDTLIPVGATGAILQRPITLGQLTTKLRELVPVEGA